MNAPRARFCRRARRAVLPCGEWLALASPAKLDMSKGQAAAVIGLNWRLAVEGRAHPAGEVILAYGTSAEVDAALARAKALPVGGDCAVEYAPPPLDEVRVTTVLAVTEHGRELVARGQPDAQGWFVVFIGDRFSCEGEATRLRRIRAGHRLQEEKHA